MYNKNFVLFRKSDTQPLYANVEGCANKYMNKPNNIIEHSKSCYENVTLSDPSSNLNPMLEKNQSGVNYIILDLDQLKSPASSPTTGLGSVQSLNDLEPIYTADDPVLTVSNTFYTNLQTNVSNSGTSQGYSTIDFIKTCALIKSSTCVDFDSEHDNDQDHEESRLTRHSKCVRKAFSVSE